MAFGDDYIGQQVPFDFTSGFSGQFVFGGTRIDIVTGDITNDESFGMGIISGFSIQGMTTVSGASGASGTSGGSGASGVSGFSGYAFSGSFSGTSGTSGFSGVSGFSGTGFSGPSGPSGPSGVSGFSGFSGSSTTGNRYFLRYTSNSSVPNGGVLYLNLGQPVCSVVGERLTASATLVGITASVNVLDGSNNYDFEFLSGPAGVPVVLGSLALASGTTSNSRRDLSAAISSGTIVGARVSRTSGSGKSDFYSMVMLVEISIP